jgi:hypothetical protein
VIITRKIPKGTVYDRKAGKKKKKKGHLDITFHHRTNKGCNKESEKLLPCQHLPVTLKRKKKVKKKKRLGREKGSCVKSASSWAERHYLL